MLSRGGVCSPSESRAAARFEPKISTREPGMPVVGVMWVTTGVAASVKVKPFDTVTVAPVNWSSKSSPNFLERSGT